MQHAPPVRERFSERERATLLAIADAVIPPGRIVRGVTPDMADRFESAIADYGSALLATVRGVIRAIDAAAYARYLRPFARLTMERRTSLLEGWRTGGYLRRSALRALLMPLKLVYFDDPGFYKELGCVYGAEAPATDERPRWRPDQVMPLAEDGELECDVVVVGTGAGGAVVGKELAELGLAVVMLEEGQYFTRKDFTARTLEMNRKLYRSVGSTLTLGNVGIPVPVGRSVGGSTTVNSGTCYRAPARVLRKWREELGLAEMTPDHLAPFYERVEDILGVAPAQAKHLGGAAEAIARGAQKLGYRHKPLLRNAPECDGKGVCCFGCPSDAKRSTNVSYVPLALRAGAMLVTSAKVDKVLVESGRAVGVTARAAHGAARLTVRARAVVLACGTFYTPVLLLDNGLARVSGQLGRNLSIHPATAAMAWYDRPLSGYRGIPQGYAIEEFHEEGILFEGATTPLDLGAASLPILGRRFVDLVESFDRVAMFGYMIEDTSRGRVYSRNGRPLITYVLNDHDVARVKRGMEILARVFFAGGARSVAPLVHGFDELRGEDDLRRFRAAKLTARDFDLTAYHPLGTCRMGPDPRSSVVSPDHAVWDAPGLYVVDGSAVPSSLAVNPQVTIMALATRAAGRIAERLA
ncbi:MAG TPA: GMC family oxidoreductase N-terminal domain-containing protein [Haliangiales bacterium]|nr:GMC family oxidoreductase N-terminal domain-containing protein [Haliangiales bacterium]